MWDQVSEMVDRFLAAGFTYFDTAYVYNGSEEAARKALVERHPRQSYTLATKLNAGAAKDAEDATVERCVPAGNQSAAHRRRVL